MLMLVLFLINKKLFFYTNSNGLYEQTHHGEPEFITEVFEKQRYADI